MSPFNHISVEYYIVTFRLMWNMFNVHMQYTGVHTSNLLCFSISDYESETY